jgi:hypothetical protein
MADQGIDTLDFGVGAEDYKLRYATRDDTLSRICGSRSRLSRSYGRAVLEDRIRTTPVLQRAWDTVVNHNVRGKLENRLRNMRMQLRIVRNVHVADPRYFGIALKNRLKGLSEFLYYERAPGGELDPNVVQIEPFEAINFVEQEQGLLPRARAATYELASKGAIPYGFVEDGRLLTVVWAREVMPETLPDWFDTEGRRLWCFGHGMTAREARGRRLFARILAGMRAAVPADDWIIFNIADWNLNSQRGVAKLNTIPFAVRVWDRKGNIIRFVRLEDWTAAGNAPPASSGRESIDARPTEKTPAAK